MFNMFLRMYLSLLFFCIICVTSALSERHFTDDNEGSISFNGRGFLQVLNPSSYRGFFWLRFSFKTLSTDGLLLFAKRGTDRVSLKLNDGKVLLRASMKGQTTILTTNQTYNNMKWTRVEVRLYEQTTLDTYQDGDIFSETLIADAPVVPDLHFKYLYFGGIVGMLDTQYETVSRLKYFGCLKRAVLYRSERIDLSRGIRSKGVSANCSNQEPIISSFPNGTLGPLQPTDFFRNDELIVYFRTESSEGLLAYLSDNNHTNVLAIELNHGRLAVVPFTSRDNGETQRTNVRRLRSNGDFYDDGEWHFVEVSFSSMYRKQRMRLIVDDVDRSVRKFRSDPSRFTSGALFLGGIPPTVPYNAEVFPVIRPFVGCISNVPPQNFESNDATCSGNRNDVTEPTVIEATFDNLSGECLLRSTSVTDPLDHGAFYFGSSDQSRHEFKSLALDFIERDKISFALKTAAEYGVLYYTSDIREIDFTGLYLFRGTLVYVFNYGSGVLEIQSSVPVNDNRWHEIRTTRWKKTGAIYVDNVLVGEGVSSASSRYLTVQTPLYVGGLPPTLRASNIPFESRISLDGCINHFTVAPQPRALLSSVNVSECQGNRETGVFFDQNGGYITTDETFLVGLNVAVSVDIKLKRGSGVIFSVGTPDGRFAVLELRSGEFFLIIDNGGGEFTATFALGETNVCDGNWHNIRAVKRGNESYIEVDNERGMAAEARTGDSYTHTNNLLYFGGLPDNVSHRGTVGSENYFGCMRNIIINGRPVETHSFQRYEGDVDLRSCPA